MRSISLFFLISWVPSCWHCSTPSENQRPGIGCVPLPLLGILSTILLTRTRREARSVYPDGGPRQDVGPPSILDRAVCVGRQEPVATERHPAAARQQRDSTGLVFSHARIHHQATLCL